jgi:hypothetical protein
MAVERLPDAIAFMFRIEMQHHSCDFAPASANEKKPPQPPRRNWNAGPSQSPLAGAVSHSDTGGVLFETDREKLARTGKQLQQAA